MIVAALTALDNEKLKEDTTGFSDLAFMKSSKTKKNNRVGNPPILARNGMSPDGTEMSLKGFKGKGIVTRHEQENFIVIARDATALRIFWKRWSPGYKYNESQYSDTICISATAFPDAE